MSTSDAMSPAATIESAAHEILVTNLRNAHSVEKQVIAVLEPQLRLLDDFPELRARLVAHLEETRHQVRRLEASLEACGASASVMKDALLSAMGVVQSSVQGFADDAVLKAAIADMMTEQLEIAGYRVLLVLADLAGRSDLRPMLEESLREEEAMAEWLARNIEAITRRFVEIKAEGGGGSHRGAATHAADEPPKPR